MKYMLELIRNNLFIHELMHGVVAIPFAVFLWGKTGLVHSVLIMFIVTYSIDLDHLVDYFSHYGFKLNFSNFLSGKYFNKKKIAYIPFHAWEWLLILGLIVLIGGYSWDSYYVAIFFGLLPHYILDSINVNSFLFYSISYRVLKKFLFPRI